MQPQQPQLSRRTVLLIGAVLAVVLVGVFLLIRAPHPVNPNTDKDLRSDAGISYAMVYKQADLYKFIGENDQVLYNVEKDLLLFAKTTRPEFSKGDSRIGFTFDKGSKKIGDTTTFTGYYYGLKDHIQLALKSHGKGVYTLSITNLKDKTNIDEKLGMNGPRNAFLQSLPIEEGSHTIRYQLTEDRVVVTFYRGYTGADVDMAVATIQKGLGSDTPDGVIYSVNGLGILSLNQVRSNLVTPIGEY